MYLSNDHNIFIDKKKKSINYFVVTKQELKKKMEKKEARYKSTVTRLCISGHTIPETYSVNFYIDIVVDIYVCVSEMPLNVQTHNRKDK